MEKFWRHFDKSSLSVFRGMNSILFPQFCRDSSSTKSRACARQSIHCKVKKFCGCQRADDFLFLKRKRKIPKRNEESWLVWTLRWAAQGVLYINNIIRAAYVCVYRVVKSLSFRIHKQDLAASKLAKGKKDSPRLEHSEEGSRFRQLKSLKLN